MSSTDTDEGYDLEYLEAEPIENEDTRRTGSLSFGPMVFVTHTIRIAKNTKASLFSTALVRKQPIDVESASVARKKKRINGGMEIAEASPTVKTKSAVRAIKRGAGDELLASFPKDSSISRQIQRKKYKLNLKTVGSRKLCDMVIPEGAKITHAEKYFCAMIQSTSHFMPGLMKDFSWLALLGCGKTTESYISVMKNFFHQSAHRYNLKTFVSDFKSASTTAIMKVFPNLKPIRCVFDLSQTIQKWARSHGLAKYYAVSELKRWIILFSKLAYLPVSDVLIGYDALVKEHERLMEFGVVDAAEQTKVNAFLNYVRQTFLYRGTIDDVRPALYNIEFWNVSEHLSRQWPVTNNAVESWNKEYNAHFPGGGKPDRSKVIRHQMDEEESVRHAISRHQLKPEEEFRNICPMQRESKERTHALVSQWREESAAAFPSNEALLEHLQLIQDALWYAKEVIQMWTKFKKMMKKMRKILHNRLRRRRLLYCCYC
uniref:MULE transposase domain-containing protein n=1 Tax=Ditylenchus dipsaci TaxID=166011 RepID=A0A915EG02_9BILA